MKEFLAHLADCLLNPDHAKSCQVLADILLENNTLIDQVKREADGQDAVAALIIELSRLLETWRTLSLQVQPDDEPAIPLSAPKNQPVHAEVSKIKSRIRVALRGVEELYEPVQALYTESCLKTNPLTAIYKPRTVDERIQLLEDYLPVLTRELEKAEQIEPLKLLQICQQNLSRLRNEIQEQDICLTHLSETTLMEEQRKIDARMAGCHTMQNVLDKLLHDLSQSPGNDSSTRQTAKEKLQASIGDIDAELLKLPIMEDARLAIADAYRQADNKELLISKMEAENNWSSSRLNLSAWYSWYRDPAFTSLGNEQKNNLACLRLLQLRDKYVAELEALDIERHYSPNSLEYESLYEEANRLVQQWHQDPRPEPERLEETLEKIVLYTTKFKALLMYFEKSKSLLQKLHLLHSEEQILRSQTACMEDTGMTELLSDSENNSERAETLRHRLQLGQKALAALKQVSGLQHELKNLKPSRPRNTRVIKLQTPQEIETARKIRVQLDEINTEIASKLFLLQYHRQSCPVNKSTSVTLPEDQNDTAEEAEAEIPVSKPVSQSILVEWHRKIEALLPRFSPGFNEWYQLLYAQLTQNEPQEQNSLLHRMDQLLHDIYFEVSYPAAPGSFNALEAMQSLCTQPLTDWQNLIRLKPPVPTEMQTLARVSSLAVQGNLDRLYRQVLRLERHYPREAALLEQATLNFHKMALLREQDRAAFDAADYTSCLADPRYECLQKHRGFKKVQELLAHLCTAILGIFTPQTPLAYRNRFVFSQTESTKRFISTETSVIRAY